MLRFPVDHLPSRLSLPAAPTIFTLTVFVAVICLVAIPNFVDGNALAWQMAILLGIFLILFLPRSIPDHIAALALLFGAGAIVQLPPEIVFSGFHSGGAWIILAGFVIGAGIAETGLGNRIAGRVLRRAGGSYGSVVYGVFLSATLLVFVLPTSGGRVMLLVPIALALAGRLGFPAGNPGSNGIVLAATTGSTIPAYAVLPSSLPNMVMLGTAKSLHDVDFSYTEYFAATFPALAVPTLIGVPWLIIRMFPAEPAAELTCDRDEGQCDLAPRMAWILAAALLLWATDFVHGLAPVWAALGAAVATMTPGLGTIRNTPFDKCVHIGPWLLIATVVSLASMIEHSGLGHLAGRELIGTLDFRPGADAGNFARIVGMSTVVGFLTTTIASPAIVISLADSIAVGAGWPIKPVLLAQIPAWFFILLPHQMPIIVVALSSGGVPMRTAARFLLTLAAAGLLGATPLYFLWLKALGYIG